MSGFAYGNGIAHRLTQITRELPLRSLDQQPGQPAILDDTYSYDGNGNVAGIADGTASSADSRTMTYDGLDRLTQTNAPNQWWISATTSYDALDNIRSNQVGNTSNYLNTFSYDPTTWHLATISGHVNWTLTYDSHGNITSKGTGNAAYGFDAADRMQSVTGKESYRYDGYGRRVKVTRTSDGKTDYPIYTMGGQLLTEDDARSNRRIDYVSLNGSLVAKRTATLGTSTWTTYEHTDALRSPTEETNAAGATTRIEHYTPYGEPGDHQYVQGPGYTGHVTDTATGLTYAQQRYYDPVMGRFLSVDPVQADDKGGDFNRYWYANNNSYRFVDPDGRYMCTASKAACARVSGAFKSAREERLSSIRGIDGLHAFTALHNVRSFYGAANVKNGVSIVDGNPKNGGVGGALRNEDGTTTITINFSKIKGNAMLAGTLFHEGRHGLDAYDRHESSLYADSSGAMFNGIIYYHSSGNPVTREQELWTERNAALTEAYAYWALGVSMPTWTKAGGVNTANVESEAQTSTAAWCEHGGDCR